MEITDEISDLVEEMTLEEKIELLSGSDFWHTEGIERLDIPSITMTDGPHGVRLNDEEADSLLESLPATSFPILAAAAATWNPDLIEKVGRAIGREAQHYNVGVLLAPGVNGKRTPVGGRNFEYFSEDPCLTARMGIAYINGVQAEGVGTSVKHFVANEQETNRMVVSSEVDERTLREIYLYPFEKIVKEARPWTVMCSYNKVNGVPMSHNNDFLTGILREEWGFEGLVVSDWGAVDDKPASIRAGLDLEMPGPGLQDERIKKELEEGKLKEKDLDKSVDRVLRMIKKASTNSRRDYSCDFEQNHLLARKTAAEAMVLLENKEDILPLNQEIEIAVIGEFAEKPRYQGGGSSHLTPRNLETPLQELKKYADCEFAPGYKEEKTDDKLLQEAREAAAGREAVIFFTGTTEAMESEGKDRNHINLPGDHVQLLREIAEVNEQVIVVTHSGSALDLNELLPHLKGLIHAWLPGEAGAGALAEIIFGKINPSGKLSETFPLCREHNPAYLHFPGTVEKVEYREGIFTGYRYYDEKNMEVQYPFGYGLSYTTFFYSGLRLSTPEISSGEKLTAEVDIQNTGDRKGSEVVQLYVGYSGKSAVRRPPRELKNFTRIELAPGEEKTVSMELKERDFAFYSEKLGRFAVESGTYKIMIGSSSRDIHLSETVELKSKDEVRPELTPDHSFRTFLQDERTAEKMEQALEILNIDPENPMFEMLKGMPLKKGYFTFRGLGLPQKAINQFYEHLGFKPQDLS